MSNQTFGRDDMNALFGGASSNDKEMAAFRPSLAGPLQQQNKQKNNPKEEPDVSNMTAAETAALLLKKSNEKGGTIGRQQGRHRTQRVFAHHELAKELSEEMQVKQMSSSSSQKKPQEGSDEHDEDDEDNDREYGASHVRKKAPPKVILRSKTEPQIVATKSSSSRRRRRAYESSSSSSDEDSGNSASKRRRPRGRRQEGSDDDDNSSSSSSDDNDNQRRQRLLARRQQEEPEAIVPKPFQPKVREIQNESTSSTDKVKITEQGQRRSEHVEKSKPPKTEKPMVPKRKPASSESSSSSDGSNKSSGSSSSSSDDDDSSSEDDEPVLAKPVFVPKNKRGLIQSEEKAWEEEERKAEREKEITAKRKMESRALVAKAVATVQTAVGDDDGMDEETSGATNAPPNDDDDLEGDKARDAWELRELERLLTAMDEMKKREKDRADYERRRRMTDEECLQEDMEAGRYHAPGSKREEGSSSGKHLQRFFHRGAYYMDEEEWEDSDVRRKAAAYARAATGGDKIDKSQLPEVMQVKKFGFAGQNNRYKGLSKEDTTDKRMSVLPIVHKKKR